MEIDGGEVERPWRWFHVGPFPWTGDLDSVVVEVAGSAPVDAGAEAEIVIATE